MVRWGGVLREKGMSRSTLYFEARCYVVDYLLWMMIVPLCRGGFPLSIKRLQDVFWLWAQNPGGRFFTLVSSSPSVIFIWNKSDCSIIVYWVCYAESLK